MPSKPPQLSIVVPYHAEPKTMHFIKRQLSYYNSHPVSLGLVIAVSGESLLINELENFVSDLKNPNFIFLKTIEKSFVNFKAYIQKIHDALELVRTPYVALNGADDLIIPDVASEGVSVLEQNEDISGVRGQTIYFLNASGKILISKDQGIMDDLPFDRLKTVTKDYSSIFYVMRRQKDLLKDFEIILNFMERSLIVRKGLYHIEHFMALRLVGLGKLYVQEKPWRVQTSHNNNHTVHTPASIDRLELGVVSKKDYEWFQSQSTHIKSLSYCVYRILWEGAQARAVTINLKQIVYRFIKKQSNFVKSVRVLAYFLSNKVYMSFKISSPTIIVPSNHEKQFFQSGQYQLLKQNYFSEQDINLIELENVNI